MGIIKKERHCAPLFVYDGSLILLYIFLSSFWSYSIFFSSYLLGVFSFLLLCISPSFRGGELLSVLPFPKFSYCISGIIKFALLCWGVGGEGKEPEGGGAEPEGHWAYVLNNVTFKCNRKRNSLLYNSRQRIQPPIISDFIVYLCRNYWINWGDGLREWEIADRFCQLIISWKGERSW